MPIYEYQCLVCGKVSDHLVLNREDFEPYCKHCGSREMKKLISRVRVRLSLDTRIERMADPTMLGAVDENDPKSVMKLVERMGAEFGAELGDDFDELMDMAREEIEGEMAKGGEGTPAGDDEFSMGAEDFPMGGGEEPAPEVSEDVGSSETKSTTEEAP